MRGKFRLHSTLIAIGLTALCSAAFATDNMWIANANGNWSDATKWDVNGVPNTVGENAIIDDGDTAVTVTVDGTFTLGNLTVGSNDTITFGEDRQLAIRGTSIVNNGLIFLNDTVNGTHTNVEIDGTVTISGSGTLRMGGSIFNRVHAASAAITDIFTNASTHTIEGGGKIGGNNFTLHNQGLIHANIAGTVIEIDPFNAGAVDATNTGTMRASNGGTLRLLGGDTFDNTGGTIEALTGSVVEIQGNSAFVPTTIVGGTLSSTGSGVIRTTGGDGGTVLQDVTVASGTLFQFGTNLDATLRGTITNNGNVEQSSSDTGFGQIAIDSDVELAGTGVWTLNNHSHNVFRGSVNGVYLTNGADHTIQGAGDIGSFSSNLVNNGTIIANQATQLQISSPNLGSVTNNGTMRATDGATLNVNLGVIGTIDNQGTIEALNASTVNYAPSTTATNNMAGVLTGGVWRSVSTGGGATVTLRGSNITQIAANTEVALSGIGSVFQVVATSIESTLTTNSGTLRILDNRDYTVVPPAGLGNFGDLELGGGTFNSAVLNNWSTGEIFGFGTIALRPTNYGTIRAVGGTLTFAAGIQGGSGTVQIDAGATLDLSGGALDSSADNLIHNGAGLNLGSNDFLVGVDYTNANFGVGNSFDARANITGTGLINASPGIDQTLSGDVVLQGSGQYVMSFGNIHVGNSPTLSYRINNAGGSGPSLRGAIQTTVAGGNITDARLGNSGATAANFGPIAPGASTADLGVTFNATSAGALMNQIARVSNNFDNVPDDFLQITGAAYRYANPTTHTPEPVNLGNRHVGDPNPSQILSITNNVPNDGFSESLNASIGTPTGGVTTNSGSFTALAPGSTNNTSLSVGYSTATPGNKSGTATISLTSNGSSSSDLPNTALTSQTVNVTGSVFRLASPSAHTPEPVDFGIIHVGDTVSQALSITNNVPNDGFSERLDASIGSPTGNATTNSGSFTALTPGSTNNTSLVVGINAATAGAKSGTATISLTSNGAGTSDLANTALTSQTVNVQAQVNNYAIADVVKLSGNGTFMMTDTDEFTLDLGSIVEGQAALTATLGMMNDAAAPSDSLAGSFTLAAPDFDLTGFAPFSGVAAGATQGGFIISLDDSAVGDFAGQITLQPQSQNPQPFSQNLAPITIHLIGEVRLGGDYNLDGTVNAADYTVWRNTLGLNVAAGTGADGSGPGGVPDGMITRHDFDYWKSRYGIMAPGVGSGTTPQLSDSAHSVPEPASFLMLAFVLTTLAAARRLR
jgi:hypothetical protein